MAVTKIQRSVRHVNKRRAAIHQNADRETHPLGRVDNGRTNRSEFPRKGAKVLVINQFRNGPAVIHTNRAIACE